MIDLGEMNTRMKDFYDVYHLLKNHTVDDVTLEEAIRQTFGRRGTPVSSDHSLFKPAFHEDKDRNTIWKAWLNKAKLDTGLQLSEVIKLISERIKPTYERLINPGS